MPKQTGPINFLNLFIMGQVFFHLIALFLAPFIAVSLTSVTLSVALRYCTATDFTALPRAGTLITGIAFLYVLAEEVWDFSTNLSSEIEANFSWFHADAIPEAKPALERYREIAAWTSAAHTIVVRVLEAALVVSGTLLSAFGDLATPYLGGFAVQ